VSGEKHFFAFLQEMTIKKIFEMDTSAKNKTFAILNLAGFAGVITMNVLANALPLNNKTTAQLSDELPNLFVPAGITFAIWGVIYLLLAGFCAFSLVRAFRTDGDATFVGRAGWAFLLSCLANMAWIVVWHYEMTLASVMVMACLLLTLITIYVRLGIGRRLPERMEMLLVHIPFSVYLGWITIATIANVAALLVASFWDRFGMSEAFWTATMIGAGIIIALLMLFRRRDVFYNLVVIWALGGILLKRAQVNTDESLVVTIAAMGGIIILFAAIVVVILKRKKSRVTESIQETEQPTDGL
jgi:hypothetical protein